VDWILHTGQTTPDFWDNIMMCDNLYSEEYKVCNPSVKINLFQLLAVQSSHTLYMKDFKE